ncbi:MAG: hypothetical protein U0V49_05765 [Saprospiraceae bacterium]
MKVSKLYSIIAIALFVNLMNAGCTKEESTPLRVELSGGEYLAYGEGIQSLNGKFKAIVDSTGILNILDDNNMIIWTTQTKASRWVMQVDGNFVGYDESGKYVYQTESYNNQGSILSLSNEGHLYVTNQSGQTAWSSKQGSFLYPGQEIKQGEYLQSTDNRVRLYFQGDGNLVLYWSNKSVIRWASYSFGGIRCVMQTDGNLVIYDNAGKALWNSQTAGNPNLYLEVSTINNGTLFMRDKTLNSSGPAWIRP